MFYGFGILRLLIKRSLTLLNMCSDTSFSNVTAHGYDEQLINNKINMSSFEQNL